MSTSIEWTEETWNPVTGCDRISPGCDNCYALTLAKRLKAMGNPRYQADGDPRTSGPGFGVTLHHDKLHEPFKWRKPRTVFVNSMSDLFHKDVSDGFIIATWLTMAQNPQHTFQVLTKRSKRQLDILTRWNDLAGESFELHLARGPEETRKCHPSPAGQLYADYLEELGEPPDGAAYPTFDWAEGPMRWGTFRAAPHNVWAGVSIESASYKFRITHLRQTPAGKRFLSLEPLLGPLGELDLTGIDWVIVGGESGHGSRPMHPDWAREIRDQCKEQEVPFFFKQWGNWRPASLEASTRLVSYSPGSTLAPPHAPMARHASKKHNLLDGAQHLEMP